MEPGRYEDGYKAGYAEGVYDERERAKAEIAQLRAALGALVNEDISNEEDLKMMLRMLRLG